jgi:AcrR family transcriptional regulator
MVRSAAALFATRGLTATSFSEVVEASGAPRGSIYHHFPEGKDQLAGEAVRWVTERVLEHQRSCPGSGAADVLAWFIAMWRTVVVSSSGASGCAVAGVALDAEAGDLLGVVRASFRAWTGLLTEQLAAGGLGADRARSIAVAALAAMEGALILCRAEGGTAPFDAVAAELMRLVEPGA